LHSQNTLDWGAVSQRIEAKSIAGKNFRLDAAVKVEAIDSTAHVVGWSDGDSAIYP